MPAQPAVFRHIRTRADTGQHAAYVARLSGQTLALFDSPADAVACAPAIMGREPFALVTVHPSRCGCTGADVPPPTPPSPERAAQLRALAGLPPDGGRAA